ncbi:SanA/YdcF family protein [Fusicatenibacter saccharivorans]|uniref:SanA/YdcF family protein n=1 Tax=Fusicatenibacter saccharivorans TaxID=1150298 RepID=UPI003D0245BE
MVITAFRFLILIVILGLCLLFGIDFYVRSSTKDRIISPEDVSSVSDADCILVLGAGIRTDGSPSPMLQDRLNTGIELYQNGAAPKLLMSGDHGRKKYNEVQTMKDIALDQGVPSEDVFMDHAGFSTYDSLYRARDVFQARKVIIVTQKYHLYRALYIARSLGLDAWGVSADTRRYRGQSQRDFREILARDKDFFVSVFKPLPKYLGDTIPITGNGDLTNDEN